MKPTQPPTVYGQLLIIDRTTNRTIVNQEHIDSNGDLTIPWSPNVFAHTPAVAGVVTESNATAREFMRGHSTLQILVVSLHGNTGYEFRAIIEFLRYLLRIPFYFISKLVTKKPFFPRKKLIQSSFTGDKDVGGLKICARFNALTPSTALLSYNMTTKYPLISVLHRQITNANSVTGNNKDNNTLIISVSIPS